MDEFELYQGQNTGERIDQAVDVVQAAIEDADPTFMPDPAPDAYIPGVENDTQAPIPYWVTNTPLQALDSFPGDVTLVTRGVVKAKVDALEETAKSKCVRAFFSGISSLPQTLYRPTIMGVNVDMTNCYVISMRLSNPAAQGGNWTITTDAASLKLDGTILAQTDVEIYLAAPGLGLRNA